MQLSRSLYFKWFLLGLVVQIITAWFSLGYHAPDEHFQLLEFSNYKMGYSPAADLPWEYAAQCRPALQPFVVYCLSKVMVTIGCYNPFTITLLLRLMMGVLIWWVICRLVLLLLPQFETERGKQLFVWCSVLLWFVPYISVRFSAENAATLSFLTAILLLLQPQRRNIHFILSGLLLGITLFLRIQMSFAILGLVIWLLFSQKISWRYWVLLILSGIVAVGINVYIDHWFYGVWVLTPLNYFNITVLQHKAAEFGVSPWWNYFKLFIESAVPPISIVLLPFFFAGLYKKRVHVFSLVCICFLIEHFIIGHKEMRFLYPIAFPFIFLCCIGIDAWLKRYPDKRYYRWVFPVLVFANCGLLLYRMFAPAQEAVSYYKYIYNHAQKQSTTLVALEQSPYQLVGVPVNFYKPNNLDMQVAQDSAALNHIIQSNHSASLLFLSYDLTAHIAIPGYQLKKVYCLLPNWVLQFNINNWEDRARIWSIYQITPTTFTK